MKGMPKEYKRLSYFKALLKDGWILNMKAISFYKNDVKIADYEAAINNIGEIGVYDYISNKFVKCQDEILEYEFSQPLS